MSPAEVCVTDINPLNIPSFVYVSSISVFNPVAVTMAIAATAPRCLNKQRDNVVVASVGGVRMRGPASGIFGVNI
jgi:hypothetical protein